MKILFLHGWQSVPGGVKDSGCPFRPISALPRHTYGHPRKRPAATQSGRSPRFSAREKRRNTVKQLRTRTCVKCSHVPMDLSASILSDLQRVIFLAVDQVAFPPSTFFYN